MDTASGSGAPAYSWPAGDDISVRVFGSGRPLIAIGFLPHANEPLGSAFVSTVPAHAGGQGTIALVGPIDPPPAEHRFSLPCGPLDYATRGYLQPLAEQVEFAHCRMPASPPQHRAQQLRAHLSHLNPDAIVLLHNDVGAHAPYLYANTPWPQAERHLHADLSAAFPHWPRLSATWTHTLSEHTYAYFPAGRIGVTASESAGIYLEQDLGVPVLTIELPIFCWGHAENARTSVLQAFGSWISHGASRGGDTQRLIHEVSQATTAHHIPMTPPQVSAHIVWSVLTGLRADLLAGN